MSGNDSATAPTRRMPRRCRWFGHKPGIETWPIMVCWCRRCGAKCDRFGQPW